jgi:peptide/nickel transport system permease protein
MIRYIIRRVIQGVFTLWAIVSLVFLLFFVGQNDPARALAGKAATVKQVQSIRVALGLNHPVWQQYLIYLNRLIGQWVPIDIALAVGAGIIWLVLGLSIGILAARRPRSVWDRSATVFVLTGLSTPTFILGLLLLYIFFYILTTHGISIFPGAGTWTPLHVNPLQWLRDLILPWITLALITAATYARLSRSSLLDTLGEDYIRTARAKGLSERRVMYRHALRAAITPIVTQFGIDLATVLGGAIITETVFGLPGLGQNVVLAISREDLPVIQGIVLVAAAFIVAANIVVDVLYAVIDPRVRLS